MAASVSLGLIEVRANQQGSFEFTIEPGDGVTLAGAVVTSEIRQDARVTAPLLVPTVSTAMDGANLDVTISWTQAQAAALPAASDQFTNPTCYAVDIELALADDPTHPVQRFFATLAVYPGGLHG